MNLKRKTSYLLDLTAVAGTISSLTRQPAQGVKLEVAIAGNTVNANGRVTVYSTAGAGSSQYVVQDRTLATKWAIQVTDGVIAISSTSDPASDEPIISDNLVSGLFWKVFVDDGVIGVEGTAINQNDEVLLDDTSTSTTYQIVVSDGILGVQVSSGSSEVFTFSENGAKIGAVTFVNITALTMSGISDGFIQIRAINRIGQPVNQEISVSDNVPVRFYTQKGRIYMKRSGQEDIADYKIMAEPDLDLRQNDIVYPLSGVVGLTWGSIDFVEKIFDFAGATHHLEAEVKDL